MEYAEFSLCREMGWSYNELDEQPAYRVEQAFSFLSAEAKQAERERKKQRRSSKGGS